MYFDVASGDFKEVGSNPAKLVFAGTDQNLLWQELKDLSDKICDRLEEARIPEGAPVIVYGEKEVFFLAAILACFRKKIPFVPVEPSLPAKRIENMIAQTKSEAILVCGNYPKAPHLPLTIKHDLTLSGSGKFKTLYADLAYILFTSGSSGEPKGVMVTRNNLVSFTRWFCKNFPISNNTILINQASFLFDISLADFFGALQAGGSAIFNSASQVQNGEFFSRLQNYQGNYWNSTPSFLSFCLTNKDFNSKNFPQIQNFTLSGEELSPLLVREIFDRFPSANVINAYGPTEACIFSSQIAITKEMLRAHSLPVAKLPEENLSIENNELIISGAQVAQGYLNGNTFGGKFASGDVVEEKDALLFYKGRKDSQVKFNGFRIELDEIKKMLERLEDIQQAECLPFEIDGKIKRLVAFVKSTSRNPASASSVKERLAHSLPHYMIPSEIIYLKEFPLTENFKINKKALLMQYAAGHF